MVALIFKKKRKVVQGHLNGNPHVERKREKREKCRHDRKIEIERRDRW